MNCITECFRNYTSKIHGLNGVCRNATLLTMCVAAFGCATSHGYTEWAAQGFLTPGPTSEPELIGLYKSEKDCREAGEAWMSQQVVGNPVFANCLPVDHN